MNEVSFASARREYREAIKLLLPPTRESVDEYAAQHRYIPRRTGNGYQLWDHDTAPYLAEPMRCLTSYRFLTACIVGPGQSGKTSIAENALLHAVAKQPRDMLWYMQTDEGVEAYVKDRINPMIRAHPEMRERLGTEPTDNTLHYKRFTGMRAQFLSATHSNLISKSSGFIVADEIDAYDPALGDPKVLLDVRRQTYGRLSMLLAMSHPDLATGLDPVKHWRGGIMRIYADSDRRVWYWPCPHCGAWSSPVPFARRVMTLEWPKDGTLDEIEREAHLLCPVNGCIVEDRHRKAMNLAAYRSPFGGWIGDGQTIDQDGTVEGEIAQRDTAGFWFVGIMSPFLLKGIGGLAREIVKAEREYEIGGDDKTLKEVIVKQCGVPYNAKGPVGSIDAETLAERALIETQPLGIVPEGVRFLTAWLDIQVAHFELLVRGFGAESESWIIDKKRIPADTATDTTAWLRLLEELIDARYPLAKDPARGMTIKAIGYDTGGAPGTSDRAYEVWGLLRAKGRIRNSGRLDGRDLWSVMPTKGAATPNAPRLSVVYPDSQRKDRKVARTGVVPVGLFNANQFKDDLAGQLQHSLSGPGYVHIPECLRSKEPPHINFEQLVAEKRDANGRWTKPHQGVRNEFLDLMVGCHVLAHLHGLRRIKDWNAPPWAWALTQDKNSLVGPMAPNSAQGGAPKKPRSIFDIV